MQRTFSTPCRTFKAETWLARFRRLKATDIFVPVLLAGVLLTADRSAMHGAAVQAISSQAESLKHVLRTAPSGYQPLTVACLSVPLVDASRTYWVRVTEDEYAAATRRQPTEISFTLKRGTDSKAMLRFPTSDHVVNLFAPDGGAVVVATSETGSALMVRAFRLEPGQVSLILERGTKFPPEFTMDRILINLGWVPLDGGFSPERTEVWEWEGSGYVLRTTVPFNRRYLTLATLDSERVEKRN